MILHVYTLLLEETMKFVWNAQPSELEQFSCQCKIYSTNVMSLTESEIRHLQPLLLKSVQMYVIYKAFSFVTFLCALVVQTA
jgi:hypothetical protein